MRSGRARPAPRGLALRPWLGAVCFLRPSPPRRVSRLGAAGPAPRGAAPQRPGGRPRLGRQPGLSLLSLPDALPPAPGAGRPGALALPRDFSPTEDRVSCSSFLSSSTLLLPPRSAVSSPARLSVLLQSLGTFFTVPVAVSLLPFSAPSPVPGRGQSAAGRGRGQNGDSWGAGVCGGAATARWDEELRTECPGAMRLPRQVSRCPRSGARPQTSPSLRLLLCPRNQEARIDGKFSFRK